MLSVHDPDSYSKLPLLDVDGTVAGMPKCHPLLSNRAQTSVTEKTRGFGAVLDHNAVVVNCNRFYMIP